MKRKPLSSRASARDPSRKKEIPRSARDDRGRLPVRAREILVLLKGEYPAAHCELDFRTPFELLVATILSAQCTDVRVNMVTPVLFARFPTAKALSEADPAVVEEIIRSTGFFRNKTKSLLGMAKALVENHSGQVPEEMEALRVLPGVGRKTANVVLGNAFGKNEGVTVDTHVARLSGLLGLTKETDPVKIEQDLMKVVPREDWTLVSHLLIWHGRRVCIARRPRCGACVLNKVCPSVRLTV
jgi:endonuclease-3